MLELSAPSASYIYWKRQLLESENMLTPSSLPRLVRRQDRRTSQYTYSLGFNIRTLFQKERALLYPVDHPVKPFPPLDTVFL